RLERELVEPHRALAAAARGDRELDRARAMQLTASLRPPRERDLTLLGRDRLPGVAEGEVAAVDPPHVGAARISELELEVLRTGLSPHAHGEAIVRGQRKIEVAVEHGVAAALLEVEV